MPVNCACELGPVITQVGVEIKCQCFRFLSAPVMNSIAFNADFQAIPKVFGLNL